MRIKLNSLIKYIIENIHNVAGIGKFSLVLVLFVFFFTSGCKESAQITVLTVFNSFNEIKNPKFEFVSLQEAVDASVNYEQCIIQLKRGMHFLDQTVFINGPVSNLKITSEPDGKAIVYGGKQITNWKIENGIWVADVPGMDFRLLEVNGKLANRSRLPEEGYFHHLSTFNSNWLSTVQGGFDPKPTIKQLLSMKYNPDDLKDIPVLDNAEITLFHSWDETLMRVNEVDAVDHEIRFTQPPAYPAGAFGITKYVVWNSKSGLKNPGQWYLDRKAGKVYYYPLLDENPENAVCFFPLIDELIYIKDAENLTISDIEFRSNNTPLMVGGFGAKWFSGAIYCENSNQLTFDNLTFCNLSSNAIKAVSCDNTSVTGSHFHHTGAAAIRLIGSDAKISNNLIHDVGLLYPSTIALYVNVTDPNAKEEWEMGKDEGNVLIAHNTIYNAPYVGICCGGKDSEITGNRISRVVQVLTDGGGIYVTFCKNLVLTRNFISDIQIQEGAGTCAYYLDELTNNAFIEENLSVNVHRPLHAHLCSGNTIRNNIFIVEEGNGLMTFPRCSDFTFEKNVFITEGGIEIQGLNVLTNGNKNILFSQKGAEILGSDVEYYTPVNKREISGNLFSIVNPSLSNYNSGIIKFESNSPAISLGIEEINVSGAGVSE